MRLDEVKGGMVPRVREMLRGISQELIQNEWLFDIHQSMRVWTRGDGSRYKDWPSIRSGYESAAWDEKETNRDLSRAPDNINDFVDVTDYLWKKLESEGKPIGDMSDEFPSIPKGPALIWNNIIFVRRHYDVIQFGSKGRLKNKSVWNVK